MRYLISGTFLVAALCAGCTGDDDDASTTDNSTRQAVSVAGAETARRGMGTPGGIPGCYDIMVHMCDCDVTEADCIEAGRIWTDRCSCGEEPSDEGSSAGRVNDDEVNSGGADSSSQVTPGGSESTVASAGCYDPTSHMCDCQLDEAACTEVGSTWTDQCVCRGHSEGDPPDGDPEAEQGRPTHDADHQDGTHGVQSGIGCYNPMTHICDCETDEMTCGESGGLWVDGCGCGN